MDIKREVKEFVDFFLKKETDYFPELPWTESEFRAWACIYIGFNRSIINKVRSKIKKLGYIKENSDSYDETIDAEE